MFAKCVVLIVAVGACGCALLALRQSRLQVASELARTQLRISAADERLWSLRAKVAAGTSPRNVERLARNLGPLKPIVDRPAEPVAPPESPRVVDRVTPRPEPIEPSPERSDAQPRPRTSAPSPRTPPATPAPDRRVARREAR